MQIEPQKIEYDLHCRDQLDSRLPRSSSDTNLHLNNSYVQIAKLTDSTESDCIKVADLTTVKTFNKVLGSTDSQHKAMKARKETSRQGISELPLSSLECSSQSILDLISPKPHISFSGDLSTKKQGFKRFKLIEELYDSEETYVTCLTLLLNYYIEPLMYCKKEFRGQTFHLFSGIIQELISLHSQALENMRRFLHVNNSCSQEVCVQIVNVVRDASDKRYIYELYCNQYDRVLTLIKSTCNVKSLECYLPWLNGWSNYLEATQPLSQRKDLTFLSLIQKPTTRLGKYRLLVEAIANSLNAKYEEEKCIILASLDCLKSNLDIINFLTKESKALEKIDLLKELVGPDKLGRDVVYFGKPLLIGCLFTVWVLPKRIDSANLGVVVFKTHLLLFDLRSSLHKNETLFSISLANCQFQAVNKDFDGGMYTNYEHSFKIVYEIGWLQYELLFAAVDAREYKVYTELLSALIDVVNGPCPMKFHSGEINTCCHSGVKLSPYDISPNNYSQKSSCYFKQLILVNIYNDLITDDDSTKNYEPWRQRDVYLRLSNINRIRREKQMAFVWSEEIPMISKEVNNISRNTSMPNLMFIRANSHRGISRRGSLINVLSPRTGISKKSSSDSYSKVPSLREFWHLLLPDYYKSNT